MHPILTQGRRLGLYLMLFLQAGVVLGELVARVGDAPRAQAMVLVVPLVLFHGFTCLASWYVAKSLPLEKANLGRLLVGQLAAASIAGVTLLLAGAGWAALLQESGEMAGTRALFRASATLLFVFGLLLYSVAAAVHYLLGALERSREAEARAYELKILAREAELRALRAQIDPHFLFNSLNSISSLTGSDPAAARRMCSLLADFLRRGLRLEGVATHTLAEELELVTTYLEIEEVRFGERLRVERRIAPESLERPVPPLILQPLVENAVGHGIAHLVEGGAVEIGAEVRGERLRLEVVNACDEERPRRQGEGIGLGNVRRRLEAAFGREARLSTREESGVFRVELTLPAPPAAAVEAVA